MATIPLPPIPIEDSVLAYGAAGGAVVVGVGLLIWGRLLHRGFLAVLGGGCGFLLGQWVGWMIDVNVLVAGVVGAVALGVLALVLARVLWAVLGGVLLSAAAAAAVVIFYLPAASAEPATQAQQVWNFPAYAQWLATFSRQSFLDVWAAHPAILAGACAAGLLPLAAGLLLPRTMAVLMSALVGTALVLAGLGVAMGPFRPAWWQASWQNLHIVAAVAAGVLLAGICVQSFGALRAGRGRRTDDADPPDGGRRRPGGKARSADE